MGSGYQIHKKINKTSRPRRIHSFLKCGYNNVPGYHHWEIQMELSQWLQCKLQESRCQAISSINASRSVSVWYLLPDT